MLAKRIIPCLDVKDGRVTKGVNFVNLRDAGDPVELAKKYCDQGADEITFLDITATHEKRKTVADLVERASREIRVPLCVGGGISSLDDFQAILNAGADKVAVNSAAVRNPALLTQAAERYGAQCVVLAVDAALLTESDTDGVSSSNSKRWEVYVSGGRDATGIDLLEWVSKAENMGAGEILLTSMDADGVKDGFDLDMLNAVCNCVSIPVIASGGCGTLQHFADVFEQTECSAALAASVFHYDELSVGQVKEFLHARGIPIRITY